VLNDEQKHQITQAIKRGFFDPQIASRLGLTPTQVARFRMWQGVTGKQVMVNRLDTWISLLERGLSTMDIAQMYELTKTSTITILLARHRGLSIQKVRKAAQEKKMAALEEKLEKTGGPFNF
jgi:hypothetical protein